MATAVLERSVISRSHIEAAGVVPTGNWVVKFHRGLSTKEALRTLKSAGVTNAAAASDFKASFDLATVQTDAFILPRIGVAILAGGESAHANVVKNWAEKPTGDAVQHVLREFYVFADSVRTESEPPLQDTGSSTWGVQAVGADQSRFTGRDIKLAVLDTGFDSSHPDFANRNITYWSGVGLAPDSDPFGHGTHCVGTAAGPLRRDGLRYGIASDADIKSYKVLGDSGLGTDGSVLLGIEQALNDGCEVIAMSFGRGAGAPGAKPNPIFESVANDALDDGSLIIAAAGNSSSRDLGHIAPIDYPANSSSILAVAALDNWKAVAAFSCGAVYPGTSVDMAAPGTGIFSSYAMPRKYRSCSGTSMAVPHVAGVACLWAQADAKLRGRRLWDALNSNAKRLRHDKKDVGIGLAFAPT